jgi:hypothetical protein
MPGGRVHFGTATGKALPLVLEESPFVPLSERRSQGKKPKHIPTVDILLGLLASILVIAAFWFLLGR